MKRTIALLLAGLLAIGLLSGCAGIKFEGSIKGNDRYLDLEFRSFNGRELHELKLREGDSLDIETVVGRGRLGLIIVDERGRELYSADKLGTGSDSCVVQTDGTYTAIVTARHSRGRVSITAEA